MNFELIDNSFQIIILGFCTIAALFLALRYKSRSLLILALAYACFCMGTTYYILYLVIMGKVPQVFYVAEISWLAAWLFYPCTFTMSSSFTLHIGMSTSTSAKQHPKE